MTNSRFSFKYTPTPPPLPGRISRDKLYMEIAELFALRSTCLRGKVGAVAIRDKRIIATGYNGSPEGFDHCTDETCNTDHPCENTIHAEANLIAFAARAGISLEGTTLYCTHSPCKKCAQLIIQSGIRYIIYKNQHRDTSGLDLILNNPKHKIGIVKYE